MKTNFKSLFTIIAVLLISASFTSWSKDDGEQISYAETIVGTWSLYQDTTPKGVREIETGSLQYEEWKFSSSGYFERYGWDDYFSRKWIPLNSNTVTYKVEGNKVYITGNGQTELLFEIASIKEDLMTIKRNGLSGYGVLKRGSRR